MTNEMPQHDGARDFAYWTLEILRRLIPRIHRRPRRTAFESIENTPNTTFNYITAAKASGNLVLCNLGCGSRHHPSWINIDFHGDGQTVLPWDLRRGLPLAPISSS